jgi:hypothetical protein
MEPSCRWAALGSTVTPGEGSIVQAALEKAAVQVGRDVGARNVRIEIGLVKNDRWGARLINQFGYAQGTKTAQPAEWVSRILSGNCLTKVIPVK